MPDSRALSHKVAIVGAAETEGLGKLPDTSMLELHAESALRAVADAGLQMSDIDGFATAGASPAQLTEYLGIAPRWVDGTSLGGGSFLAHVGHAVAAITAGYADTVLITHGESGRSRVGVGGGGGGSATPGGQFEGPFGLFGPPSTFSIPVARHMKDFGTTEEQIAAVSVATRQWAEKNPRAMMRDPITVQDVLDSRMVCWPFHLLNCCLVTDGGGALVLVSEERADDFPKKPIWVLGRGEATQHTNVSMMRDFAFWDHGALSGREAFHMADVDHSAIDHAMFYDAFSHTPMYALEALGFVEKGESGPFFAEMRTAPGGDFPMNTNGGGLSYTHTGMYGMFAIQESVAQLRGESGDRQVDGVETGIVHAPGGMFSLAATLILGNQ
ncbi:MAG: acetyl-CoA acetyltransferase [Dehalococcoidia bacterium]|jgi:acetyl-CoA acetyltransferase|nr:acetyl-CoA acetyltransferase [Dehalococcoidia bacterium]